MCDEKHIGHHLDPPVVFFIKYLVFAIFVHLTVGEIKTKGAII